MKAGSEMLNLSHSRWRGRRCLTLAGAIAGGVIVVVACQEVAAPPSTRSSLAATADKGLAIPEQLRCDVDVHARTIRCQLPGSLTIAAKAARRVGAADVVIGGGQGQYITYTTANFAYDSIAQIFSFNLNVGNALQEPLGTPDGTTVTGVKVFLSSGPTTTGGTGTCSVANATGTANFTAPNQPYFLYPQIVLPAQASANALWKFNVPRTVTNFAFTIEAFAAFPAQATVKLTPPDSLPWTLYKTANVVTDTAVAGADLLRHLVVILFQDTAALASRQLAIAKIGGAVVGGETYSATDGPYIVKLAGSGTSVSITNALDSLNKLPQVMVASSEALIPGALAYRRPSDSARYSASWQINPDSATGLNWSPEAVAAPLGWGCSIGDVSVHIGIVDHAWHSVADLDPNVTSTEALNAYSDTTNDHSHSHGTEVNAILAARGNNGQGIAGMMWNAGLSRHEAGALRYWITGRPLFNADGSPMLTKWTIIGAIARATIAGAKAINVSMQLSYNAPPTAAQTALAHALGGDLATTFKWLSRIPGVNQPLLVVAAGNSAVDAAASGFPYAEADASIGSGVLVVGASVQGSPHAGTLWSRSNTGTLVQVAAPGANVTSLDELGRLRQTNGTSFAAPVVTGLAGQMLSMDPTLAASDLKTLIIQGAQNGGRTASGIPIVNAYETLKLLARRPGASLCGNQVFESGGTMFAVRDLGGATLATLPASHVTDIDVMHGGNRIRYQDSAGSHDLVHTGGTTWALQTVGGTDTIAGGTWRGLHLQSHDGDTTGVLQIQVPANFVPDTVEVVLTDSHSGQSRTIPVFVYANPRPDSTCIEKGTNCISYGYLFGPTVYAATAAYSPRGDRVLVAVDNLAQNFGYTAFQCCNSDGASFRDSFDTLTSNSVTIYSFDPRAASPHPTAIATLSGESVWWIGMAEGDSTIVAGTGQYLFGDYLGLQTTTPSGCGVQYFPGSLSLALATYPTADACQGGLNSQLDDGSVAPEIVHAPRIFVQRTPRGFGPVSSKRRSRLR